jgi:anti-anti-sigma regulatory factor
LQENITMGMHDTSSIVVHQNLDGSRELQLTGDITVSLATELHNHSIELAQTGQSVTVNCEQADALDVAALQILVALKDR